MEQEKTALVEWVDIVDDKNEVVAQATRQQMRAENLRHRATYIVVHDGMGKILAQRRTGIAGVPFAEHGQFYYDDESCRVWGSLFSCVSHGPFALQAEEIEEVCWLTPSEITERCDEFTPDSLKALSLWLTRNNSTRLESRETVD